MLKSVDEYQKEAHDDLDFDLLQFEEYSKSIGLKRVKWGRYLFEEEYALNILRDQMQEKYKDRFRYYAYQYSDEKVDKKFLDIYIKGDAEYREVEKKYNVQKSRVDFVQSVLNTLDKQSFHCSNVLKHKAYFNAAYLPETPEKRRFRDELFNG